MGRKVPLTVIILPGVHWRVSSPERRHVMDLYGGKMEECGREYGVCYTRCNRLCNGRYGGVAGATIHIHINTYTPHTHTQTLKHTHNHTHIKTHPCMYTHTHTHTHTHAQTQTCGPRYVPHGDLPGHFLQLQLLVAHELGASRLRVELAAGSILVCVCVCVYVCACVCSCGLVYVCLCVCRSVFVDLS
jgi:hypothetical protein